MSRDCCVALLRGATSLSAVFFIVVFPDHTHLQIRSFQELIHPEIPIIRTIACQVYLEKITNECNIQKVSVYDQEMPQPAHGTVRKRHKTLIGM